MTYNDKGSYESSPPCRNMTWLFSRVSEISALQVGSVVDHTVHFSKVTESQHFSKGTESQHFSKVTESQHFSKVTESQHFSKVFLIFLLTFCDFREVLTFCAFTFRKSAHDLNIPYEWL